MRKLFLTLLIGIFSVITSQAETLYYNVTSIACSINNAPWSDWYRMNCLFVINQDSRQIIVESDVVYNKSTNLFNIDRSEKQFITYGNVITSYGTNSEGFSYRMETITGYDKNGTRCNMEFLIFDDGDKMFIIEYNDIKYKYMLNRIS
jgi:hypothetical protein